MPPELDECVFLHTSNGCESGFDDTGPHAYFTIRLSADALTASAVLEGICGSPGIAKLPEHVTDEDFLLWRNVSPEFPPEPTEDLVRVLKVGDALSDKRMQAWSHVLGARAATTDWRDSVSSEMMHAALLSLPSNIRAQTLQQLLTHMPPDEALLCLPPTLHPFIVAAMITPDGELEYPFSEEVVNYPFLTQLRVLPPTGHPPLRSLLLDALILSPSTCYVLIDALASHPRLSQLRFDLPGETYPSLQVMRTLCPSLRAAESLRHLTVTNHDCFTPIEVLQPLADALPALTALEELSVGPVDMCKTHGSGVEFEFPSAEDTVQLRRQWRAFLAAVAAHAPLSAFSLAYVHAYAPLPWPEAFPHLRQLTLHCESADGDTGCFRNVVGLPSGAATRAHPAFPALVRLSFELRCGRTLLPSHIDPYWLPYGAEGPPCDAMRHLSVKLRHTKSVDGEMQIWRTLAGALAACPGLEHLRVDSDRTHACAPQVAAHLHHLPHLASVHLCGTNDGSMPPPAAADVADALCALPGLRAVSMHAAPDPERCFAARALRGLCSARHAGLTRLALHLGWGIGVSRGGHGGCGVLEAVRPLTGLQALALSECRLDGEAMRQLRGAVLAMPRLHDLGLNSIKVAQEDLEGLAVAVQRMTALTRLDLRSTSSLDVRIDEMAFQLAVELRRAGHVRHKALHLAHNEAVGSLIYELAEPLADLRVLLDRDSCCSWC